MLRIWDGFLAGSALLSAGILAATALAITINIALRNLGLPVIYGTLDAVEYGLLVTCFLCAPWVLSKRAHVQVDLVVSALPRAARQKTERLANGIGALVCLGFAYYGFAAMLASMARGSMIRTSFVIPEWWVLCIVPGSLLLCAVEFTRQLLAPPPSSNDVRGL